MHRARSAFRYFAAFLFCLTANAAETYDYEVLHEWPHDPTAFTQGLAFKDGVLYESTGLRGQSTLRRVELTTGSVAQKIDLAERDFGEGITLLDGKIFQLTWREQRGYIYDARTLKRLGTFRYDSEGWGLTTDNQFLIMSDGTAVLRFLDPKTFTVKRRLKVREDGRPVARLNELEYVKGEIYANVWERDAIARIDPRTGNITGWIDLSRLVSVQANNESDAVLNGIAYDDKDDRLFVTGKRWTRLYEIRLKSRSAVPAGR